MIFIYLFSKQVQIKMENENSNVFQMICIFGVSLKVIN